MADFRTDFKDEIPSGGQALYDIVAEDGTTIQTNVKIIRSNANEQDGDVFGAKEVNDIHTVLNKEEKISPLVTQLLNMAMFTSDPTSTINELGNYINTSESED